jgi:hypothetical protein
MVMVGTEDTEFSCYTRSDSFLCSLCASRTSRVEAVADNRGGDILWLCQSCYRKVIERDNQEA